MGKDFDCIDGNMNILMYNNTVKKLKDVQKGDVVYAVQFDGEDYRYIRSEVTSANKRRGNAVKITLTDGRSLICSPNHQWLTQLGWMFSYDDDTLVPGKIYLKEDVKMSGITGNMSKSYLETRLYMEGYFVGTEIYGKNMVPFKGGDIAEFAFLEPDVTMRMYNYLLYFGADVTVEDCFAHDIDTNEYYITKKLNLPYKQMISLSEKFSKNQDKEDFLRGFVAGVYDSDGTVNPIVKKVTSVKREFLDIMKKGLELFEFEYEYNSSARTCKLLGGPSELLRFYNIYTPVNTEKLENVTINDLHHERITVVTVEEVKCDDMVEITTTARNFITNGIISHNCTTGVAKEV